jgi:3-hydroxybutyryl-CoA dehydrogenase
MNHMNFQTAPILVVGDERTAFSVSVCLLQAQHRVTLYTRDKTEALNAVNAHLADLTEESLLVANRKDLEIQCQLNGPQDFHSAIVVNNEDLPKKQWVVHELEAVLPDDALIAVNTESIPLSKIQEMATVPGRIIGANWTEPAHTTFFLEVISNKKTRADLLDDFVSTARSRWHKDPYVLYHDNGIRSRMISAMVREAFFLVENDYVTIEDVDRACRNDPGYYLPFAGHCRYMDLMGTYVYGAVMKDLNPELSKDSHIPPFFTRIVREEEGEGIRNRKGFYKYEAQEVEKRAKEFRKFSYEIRDLISKYAFSDLENGMPAKKKAISNA